MKYLITALFFLFFCGRTAAQNLSGSEQERKALEQTSIGIRTAFATEDVSTILSYHHPEVRKALAYKHLINGRAELEKDLKNTFSHVRLKWLENHVESLVFHNNTAIEMTSYTIEVTPKNNAKAFLSKGRAMIVYVKSKESPTGWASIREVIQPEAE